MKFPVRISGLALALLLGVTAPGIATADGIPGLTAPRAGETWAVMSGATLRATLGGWARSAEWTLVWDSPVDYRIRASASFRGDFTEVVGQLVDAIHRNNPSLTVCLYLGNRVIHVDQAPGSCT